MLRSFILSIQLANFFIPYSHLLFAYNNILRFRHKRFAQGCSSSHCRYCSYLPRASRNSQMTQECIQDLLSWEVKIAALYLLAFNHDAKLIAELHLRIVRVVLCMFAPWGFGIVRAHNKSWMFMDLFVSEGFIWAKDCSVTAILFLYPGFNSRINNRRPSI